MGGLTNFSWIIDHPYVAQAAKSDVFGKSRDEIALMLVQAVDGNSEGLEHQRQDLCGYKI